MPDFSANPWETSSALASKRPQLTPRGFMLLALSAIAVIYGLFLTEPRWVHLGLLGLLVSGGAYLWADRNLRKIVYTRSTPDSAFAGQLFTLTLQLTNDGKFCDAFAVECEESVAGPKEKGLRAHWLQVGQSTTREMQSRLQKRGLLHPSLVRMESSFPLGLWKSRCELKNQLAMTLYPRPVLPKMFEEPNLMNVLETNDAVPESTDWEGDLHGLREFQPGDRVKHIHWPTSARSQHLVVKQFDRQRPSRITLVFHSIRPDLKPPPADVFESALELLCGMLLQWQKTNVPVDLIASFNDWAKIPLESPQHLDAVLITLAKAERKADRSYQALHEVLARTEAGDRVIILSDVPVNEWQGNLPELPCASICLGVAEIYIRQPRIKPKSPVSFVLA